MRTFRLAMAQINVTVGDLEGNTDKILGYIEQAQALGADLVAFPELAIPGYPPEDLLFKPQFIGDNIACMQRVAEASGATAVVVGFADGGTAIYNAAAVAQNGALAGVYHKIHLPNYGVFDEVRYFKPGHECPVYVINDVAVGVNICEDIWCDSGPTNAQRAAGAGLIVNINGSPFHAGKGGLREEVLVPRARDNQLFVAYVNLVGGQDELVFDGASMALDPSGEIIERGSQFEEELIVVDLDVDRAPRSDRRPTPPDDGASFAAKRALVQVSDAPAAPDRPSLPDRRPRVYDAVGEVYAALVLGTRDYVGKCGFDGALVALSGGIDSSLVAAVAADALGSANVTGVAMPSRFSSEGSLIDARALAENLGIELKTIPIEDSFAAYLETLAPYFEGTEWGVAEENLQSRIRGNLVMALSNKFGRLVLTTGNKSEVATGYTTIYGDMAGGFAVIKDVPKELVYELARHRNGLASKPVIPQGVLNKPPSAELRPDQKDEDSLPPYSTLDPILKLYVEEDRSVDQIVAQGFDEAVIRRVIALVDNSEYKRRQAAPGIKVTPRNFGRDRRMPIANRYQPP